jgi:GTPase SAR1 family protein
MSIFKLILVGDEKVGKTCIINRYINNQFSPAWVSTCSHDQSLKTIENLGQL